MHLAELQKLSLKQVTAKQDDPLGIQLFDTATRPFWIKKNGTDLDGQHLLTYVIAQQQWISEAAPDRGVRKTDAVLDIGAHTLEPSAKLRCAAPRNHHCDYGGA